MYFKQVFLTTLLLITSILFVNNANAQCTISSSSFVSPTTCGGTNGSITFNGLGASATYTVNYKLNGVSVTPFNVVTNASGVLVISALGAGTYSALTVTKGCTSTSQGPFTLSNPAAPATPTTTASTPVCSGNTISLTASSTTAGVTYSWTGPNAFTSTSQNPSITNATTAMSGTYSVIAILNGCSSAVATRAVTVNATPVITASNNGPVCQGTTLNLTASTVAGATYHWSGPSAYTSTSQNPSRTNATTAMTGTYSVYATVSGCNSATVTTSATVNAKPATPTTTSNTPVCSGNNISLTATSTTSGVTYSWTGPNSYTSTAQNPIISAVTTAAAGTYSVVATANGCSSSVATRAVTVNVTPAISSSSFTNPTTCTGTNGTIILNGLTANTAYTCNLYKNGVAMAAQNITANASGIATKTGLSAGVYSNITLSKNSCPSTVVGPYTLSDPAAPTATASNNGALCQGTTLTLTAGTVAGATYKWTGPSAYSTTTQSPSRTNATTAMSGVYTLTVKLYNCTSSPATTTVTVNALPATPTASSNTPVCSGTTLNLFAASATPSVTYSWTGPNTFTSTSQNPTIATVTTAAAGTYTVKAIANGCNSANATTSVVVNASPAISSASTTNPTTCGGTNGVITLNGLTPSSTFTVNYNKNGVAASPTAVTSNASGVGTIPSQAAASYTNFTATKSSCTSAAYAGPVVISDPSAPSITSTGSVNPTGCATTDGSINLNGLTTNTTYTVSYNKNGIAITPVSKTSNASGVISLTALTAGTYSNITVSRSSCTSVPVGPIYLTGTPVFTTSFTNPTTCSGNGTISLNGLFGSTNYTVNYKKNGVAQTALNLATNAAGSVSMTLTAGSYSNINVTTGGCTSADAATVTLTNPTAPAISSVSSSNTTTCGGADGTITLNGLGNSKLYTVNYNKNGVAQSAITATSSVSGTLVLSFDAGTYSSFVVTNSNCSSNSAGPATISDPTVPVITVSNNGPLCKGATLNLTATTIAGATYNWSGPNGFSTTSQNPSVGGVGFADTGSYILNVIPANNCIPAPVATTLSINTPAAPIASNSGTTCAGLPVTFNASSTTSGVTYNWYGPNGYTSASQNPVISAITAAGAGTYSVVATFGGCTSDTTTSSIIVNPGFTVNIAGTTSICSGSSATINLSNGPAIATVLYTINNGTNQTAVLDSNGSFNIYTGSIATNTTYKLVSVDNGSCIFTKNDSAVVTVTPNSWTGTSDNDWNNAANWCGGVPTATMPVLIPTGTTYSPVLPNGTSVANQNLTVATGAVVTVSTGSNIDVSGDAVINGTIIGSGNVNLNGTSNQTISGRGTVTNLTLNNTMGATINNTDTLKVTGMLTLTSGQLTTNNALVLTSNSQGTACIGPVTGGTINGNVIMERYIPAGRRLYRFFSHPYRDTVALNPELTSQIDVTGFGGAANGFTATQTNNASAFWYNPLTGNTNPGGNGNDPGWTAFTSANATSGANGWKPYQGIRVLVRGSKGQGLAGQTYTPDSSKLRMFGRINTGTINIPIVKGTNSGYNVLGNPYPSAVNLGPIMYSAYQSGLFTGSAYYVWDASAGTTGAYITQHIHSASDYYNLPAGGAFVVNAAANGTITFRETDKVTTGINLFKTTNVANDVEFNITSNNDSIYWDRMFVSFNDQATAAKENFDGGKSKNPIVNFYTLSDDNQQLAVDARSFTNNMTIPVGFKTTETSKYKIKVANMNLAANQALYLMDSYTNTVTTLQPGTEYEFDVTADSASQGDNRFSLNGAIANPAGTTGVTTTAGNTTADFNFTVAPNPAVNNTTVTIHTTDKAATAVSVSNISGLEVFATTATNNAVQIPLNNLPAGIYMVKVTCGNKVATQRLVKE